MRWAGFHKQVKEASVYSQGLTRVYNHLRLSAQRTSLTLSPERKGHLVRKLLPLLTGLLVIAITFGVFLYRDSIAKLDDYGYLGAFLANLVSNATVFFPVPGGLIIFALGAALSPLLVGLAGGTGAAIGELTGYILGYSGRAIIKNGKAYEKSVGWLKKWGTVAVFVFTVTPLPLDLIGIAAGVLRFPVWKFFLACWFGKSLLCVAMALAGAWGWKMMLPYIS